MKYMIDSTAVLIVCIAAGAVISHFAYGKKKVSWIRKVLTAAGAGMIIMAVTAGIYFQAHYEADEGALTCLSGNAQVEVSEIPEGYWFNGPGEEAAVIIYPGAKIDTEAYAPLAMRLAEAGVDSFIVRMPLRMAIFGSDSADSIISSHEGDYGKWYLAGHSLGGSAASSYAADHTDRLSGLILLAAYPASDIPDGIRFLSIYGSEDGCLERGAYEDSRGLWPDDAEEAVITGGNHAYFGSYGDQKGDGTATLTPDGQQKETARKIIDWINI